MLSSIRKFSTSWYAKILLGIIVIPFIFWGMGGVFTGGNKNVIVVIDKDKFSTQEFANFVRSQQIANEKINSERIDQFLSTFIGNKLIEKEYNNFGVKLSDNSLSKLIKIQKEFKKENKFSRTKYEKFLIFNNLNAVSFEANLANQEKKKQLLNFIGGGIIPSKFIVNDIYNKINQKRKIEIINLSDIFIKEIVFPENEIEVYYENNKEKYSEIYKSLKVLEINPKKLIGTDEFNDIFFKKIDDIHDLIIQGAKLDTIINEYNLGEAIIFKINKFGQDSNYKTINDLPEDLVKNAFLISDEEPTALIEIVDKFFIIEIFKTENIRKDLTNENVRKDIKKELKILKIRKFMSEIISKINQNNFKKLDFDNLSKEKNVVIQKITLENLSDNKILKEQVVNQIYAFPEKKIIVANDIELSENFLIYIEKIISASINENSDEYQKYLKLSKISITNGLFNTYDNYIKKKYEIDINYKALKTVKNYFN